MYTKTRIHTFGNRYVGEVAIIPKESSCSVLVVIRLKYQTWQFCIIISFKK